MSEQALPVSTTLPADISASAAVASPRRFVKRVAWTFGAKLVMVISGLGSSIIAARWLGTKGFGQLSVVNATGALALQIGSAGLPSAMVYFVAKDRRIFAPAAINALLFAIAVGSVLTASVVAFARFDPALFGFVPAGLMTVGAISIPFLLIMLLGLNLLLAIERIAQFNLIDAAAPVLVLVNSLVVLVLLQSGVFALVSANTVAAVLIGLVTIFALSKSRRANPPKGALTPDLSLFREMISYAVKFYVSILAGVIIIRADLLIVNHFRGPSEAGVYSAASQVATLLMLLPGVIATLLFPQIASSDDKQGVFAMRVTRHTSFIMLVSCMAAIAVAFVLPYVYGLQFRAATAQLLILLPGVYLISIESVLVQHFTATGLPAAIPWFWVLTVIVSVGLNLLFVPTYGASAAAVSSTISYGLIFFLVAFYFRARTKHRLGEILVLRRSEFRKLLTKFPVQSQTR
jgi:O-antigen/teichoic acid export membrane protein